MTRIETSAAVTAIAALVAASYSFGRSAGATGKLSEMDYDVDLIDAYAPDSRSPGRNPLRNTNPVKSQTEPLLVSTVGMVDQASDDGHRDPRRWKWCPTEVYKEQKATLCNAPDASSLQVSPR